MAPPFTQDDISHLKTRGFITARVPPTLLLPERIEVAFGGLEHIYQSEELRAIFLDQRPNKDVYGRLQEGYFEKPDDHMRQVNFQGLGSGRFEQYRHEIGPGDLQSLFDAFTAINEYIRRLIDALAHEIDTFTARLEGYPQVKIQPLLGEAAVLTSATQYRAQIGIDATGPRANTAGFAVYLYAKNAGMRIIDRLEIIHDLTDVERDQSQLIIVVGEELSLLLNNLIGASMHPIFPERDGELRESLRAFVYFNQSRIKELDNERQRQLRDLSLL